MLRYDGASERGFLGRDLGPIDTTVRAGLKDGYLKDGRLPGLGLGLGSPGLAYDLLDRMFIYFSTNVPNSEPPSQAARSQAGRQGENTTLGNRRVYSSSPHI